MYYVKERQLRRLDMTTAKDVAVMQIRGGKQVNTQQILFYSLYFISILFCQHLLAALSILFTCIQSSGTFNNSINTSTWR